MNEKKTKCHKKKILFFIILFSMLFFIKSDNVYATSDDSEQREVIRVGFFAMDGYHMMDKQGNRSGYGYDFLQLVSRYLDVDFEYVGYNKSWDEMQMMLENGEINLLTSARKTPEREALFDFSRPIGDNSAILTIRSDNNSIIMHDFTTYNGMRIALLKGNSRNADLASFARENGFHYSAAYFDTVDEMTKALQKGKVDGIVTSSLRQTKNERIIVTIPFEIASKAEETETKTEQKEVSISNMKLLMAEDNELNAEIARSLLESEGAKVTVVSDGQQSVDLFSEKAAGTFDAILMDVMMPNLDGLAATKKIRAMRRADAKTIPIIAITANAFEEDRKKCLEAGMNAYLTKPLDMEKVKSTIYTYVKGRTNS